MGENAPGLEGGARESRAFFAALLAACRSSCDCETCQILRSVADSMTKEFTVRGGGGVKGTRAGGS
jgi:hypothetical protein